MTRVRKLRLVVGIFTDGEDVGVGGLTSPGVSNAQGVSVTFLGLSGVSWILFSVKLNISAGEKI